MANPSTGTKAATLLLAEREWIHRRVESLRVGPELLIRRHLSVDFSVPDDAPPLHNGTTKPFCYLPLSFIRKEPSLVWFDLRDEADRPLPLITKPENTQADTDAFLEFARLVLDEADDGTDATLAEAIQAVGGIDQGLPESLANELRAITTCRPREARRALIRLYRPVEAHEGPEFALRRTLCRSDRFTDLAEQLVTSRFLWVPLEHRAGERRIVKLAYEIPTPNRLSIWRTIKTQFGVRQVYWIEPQHMGNQSSYHLTVVTADELEIIDADLLVDDDENGAERQLERTVAHLHLSGRGLNVPALAYVVVRVERQGYLSSAALAGVSVAALLGLLAHYSGRALTRDHLDGTIAVLLIVPAIVAAFMARPAYRLADRRLLLGLRSLALGIGAATVASAISALAATQQTTHRVWVVAALFCAGTAAAHALAMFFPRRRRELSSTR